MYIYIYYLYIYYKGFQTKKTTDLELKVSTISRRTCNCMNISQSPLQQNCLSNNILYQANITPAGENSETKVYYGICKTSFKLRYTNHTKSQKL